MAECLTLWQLEEGQKKGEAEGGSGTWWDHKSNVETSRSWSKAYPTAHLQPKLVDWYCTNNLERRCHKTHPKKGKRQADPSATARSVCSAVLESFWRGSSTKGSHSILSQTQLWFQHKRAIKNSEAPKTNWLSWCRTSKMPSKRRRFWQFVCFFFWLVKGLRQSFERGATAKAFASGCTWQNVQVAQWLPLQ